MLLESERLRFRVPEREHVDLFLRWLNDPEVCRYLHRVRPLHRAEEEEWLLNGHKRAEDVAFLIVRKEEERPIGSCGLHRISLPNRSAELGILIGEKEFWNRGYGGEAMGLLCRYGFDVLNLHRIGLSVYDYNGRGIRCYERVGFRIEGRRREARFWDGSYADIVEMGLLASEWRGRGGAERAAPPAQLVLP